MKSRAGRRTKVSSRKKAFPKQRNLQQDAQLQRLLSELAVILLPFGITPMHFSELAKRAFVEAAGRSSRFRNGKLNQSRIAVITGLNRSEVKRVLDGGPKRALVIGSRLARTERVVSGWLSDRRFVDRNGQPRRLPINGRNNSFEALVRAFAGDVPYRAVLDELKRGRSVAQVHDSLELNTSRSVSRARLTRSLSKVLPALLDAIQLAAHRQGSNDEIPMYRLTLGAKDSVELAFLRDRLSAGALSLISGFKESLKRTAVASTRQNHTITITAFVRESSSSRKTRGAP
jgi:hypothetical protein